MWYIVEMDDWPGGRTSILDEGDIVCLLDTQINEYGEIVLRVYHLPTKREGTFTSSCPPQKEENLNFSIEFAAQIFKEI